MTAQLHQRTLRHWILSWYFSNSGTGERVHKVRELLDFDACTVEKDFGKCRIPFVPGFKFPQHIENGLGTAIIAIAIRTVLIDTTAREFERKAKATGNIMKTRIR